MYIRSLLAIVSALLITASIAHSEMWPVHPEENGGERYEVCSVDLVNGACPGQMVTVYRNAVGSPQGLESDFGPRRQESPMHQGIDYAVSGGTPVYAVRGGTVTFKDPMAGSSGYTIIIQDAQGMYHAYRHLTQDDQAGSVYSPLVERFQTVLEGQQIGWSGNTGTGTYHLHYDYYQETAAGEQLFTNPLSILPYNNQRSPIVEIEQPTPDGTTVLGTGANRIQEVIARVRSAEKDVSRVNITISPGNIERDFNFEREGRNQVSVQQNANGAGAVNSDHFVRPGAMTQGTGESNDAFIYRWNLSQYLASLGQISADNVTIRVKAWDAQGLFSTTERTVSVGNNAPTQRAELQPAGPAVKEAPTAMASIEPVDGKSPFTPQEMVWHAELAVASEIQLFKPTLSFSAGNTKASYNQKITGLEDGPHSATFKLVDKEGQVLEQKQELFFLDTTPPTLELVSPLGSEIPPSVTMFVVRFDDQGSGIPSIPKEMKLSALVNNQNATSNTAEKSGQRFLILDAKKVPWSPGQAVTLDVTIEDRAGNTAELHKTYTVEQPVEAITGKTAVLTLPIIRPAKTVVFTAGGGAQGLSTPASRILSAGPEGQAEGSVPGDQIG